MKQVLYECLPVWEHVLVCPKQGTLPLQLSFIELDRELHSQRMGYVITFALNGRKITRWKMRELIKHNLEQLSHNQKMDVLCKSMDNLNRISYPMIKRRSELTLAENRHWRQAGATLILPGSYRNYKSSIYVDFDDPQRRHFPITCDMGYGY